MIQRHAGRMQIVCACGFAQPTSYERDEFDIMVDAAREAGWAIQKVAGDWEHTCPPCREAARPRARQGRLL